jgi:hypothetical protein
MCSGRVRGRIGRGRVARGGALWSPLVLIGAWAVGSVSVLTSLPLPFVDMLMCRWRATRAG